MNVKEVIDEMKKLPKYPYDNYQEWMKRFGVESDTSLGIPIPELRKFAKKIGKNHKLALELWKENIHDAKFIASFVAEAEKLTEKQMDTWVNGFYSWDTCDVCCSSLLDKTPFYEKKIWEYVKNEKEFVRRTGFVLMATSAVHDKKALDKQFIRYFPLIKKYSTDKRNFVKKAVNWALRQIGKRNMKLYKSALKVAKELKKSKDRTARWIGSDAARELENPKIIERVKKRGKK